MRRVILAVALVLLTLSAVVVACSTLYPGGAREGPGRLVQTGLEASSLAPRRPIIFLLDDFVLMKLDDDRLAAFYIYPPSYFGHAEGCTIRWEPDMIFTPGPQRIEIHIGPAGTTFTRLPPPAPPITGLWYEGCGGAKWDAAGQRLFGPASGNLDQFPVSVENGFVLVDTTRLLCGLHGCQRAAQHYLTPHR